MIGVNCYITFADKDYQLVVEANRLDVIDGLDISTSKVVAFLDDKIVAIIPMSRIESAYLK